jgi:hypothetical protein
LQAGIFIWQNLQNMESDNIYDRILQMFGKIPENFSILEDQIDINVQLDYFEKSKKLKQNPALKKTLEEIKSQISDSGLSIEGKKDILIQLANCSDVEAFRILEKLHSRAVPDLKDWSALALQESKMNLECMFLDENQVIISTGLGGKGKNLRYFAAIRSKNQEEFTTLQKKLVEKEFDFLLKKNNGEIERIEFDEQFCTLVIVLPLHISIKELIEKTIEECNQLGNFIHPKFVLTNVKIFSKEEIRSSWTDLE